MKMNNFARAMTLIDQIEGTAQEPSCATCRLKERVYISSPNGDQHAAIWRCRELSTRFRREVVVTPEGSCYENNSLTDYYQPEEETLYVW